MGDNNLGPCVVIGVGFTLGKHLCKRVGELSRYSTCHSEDDNETITYTPASDVTVYISIFPYMSMGNQYEMGANIACP